MDQNKPHPLPNHSTHEEIPTHHMQMLLSPALRLAEYYGIINMENLDSGQPLRSLRIAGV